MRSNPKIPTKKEKIQKSQNEKPKIPGTKRRVIPGTGSGCVVPSMGRRSDIIICGICGRSFGVFGPFFLLGESRVQNEIVVYKKSQNISHDNEKS